jgi:hypothetical protein
MVSGQCTKCELFIVVDIVAAGWVWFTELIHTVGAPPLSRSRYLRSISVENHNSTIVPHRQSTAPSNLNDLRRGSSLRSNSLRSLSSSQYDESLSPDSSIPRSRADTGSPCVERRSFEHAKIQIATHVMEEVCMRVRACVIVRVFDYAITYELTGVHRCLYTHRMARGKSSHQSTSRRSSTPIYRVLVGRVGWTNGDSSSRSHPLRMGPTMARCPTLSCSPRASTCCTSPPCILEAHLLQHGGVCEPAIQSCCSSHSYRRRHRIRQVARTVYANLQREWVYRSHWKQGGHVDMPTLEISISAF